MNTAATNQHLEVLVVDDTITYRSILSSVVGSIPELNLLATANNGKIALEKLAQHPADLVLLDVEMPEMDGLEALQHIKKLYPKTMVVMVSGISRTSASITMKALNMGALDFIPKPDHESATANFQELSQRLKTLVPVIQQKLKLGKPPAPLLPQSPLIKLERSVGEPPVSRSVLDSGVNRIAHSVKSFTVPVKVIIIGVSTGGPNALAEVIPALPAQLNVPVLIVQHMPPVFTASLAEHLNKKSALSVKEAQLGELVLPNHVYIAPGGFHMVVEKHQNQVVIGINEDPPENSCRPAADVLFRSVAQCYSPTILSVVMTGMGNDGALGVQHLKRHTQCYCLTQSADTCVVYGMPKAVDDLKLSDEQLPVGEIARRISELCRVKVGLY